MKINIVRTVELAVVVTLVLGVVSGIWLVPDFFSVGHLQGLVDYLQAPISP